MPVAGSAVRESSLRHLVYNFVSKETVLSFNYNNTVHNGLSSYLLQETYIVF